MSDIESPIDAPGGQIARRLDPSRDLVAFDECKAYRLPDQRVMVRNPRTGQQAAVPPQAFQLLTLCPEFKTLNEHVDEITRQHPGLQAQSDQLRGALESSFRDGLLVSAGDLCAVLSESSSTDDTPGEGDRPAAAIITWERPGALARLLESMRKNFDANGVDAIYVIDDSRDKNNIRRNEALVEQYADDSGAPAQYVGQPQQQAFMAELVKRIPQHEEALRHLADQTRWRDDWTSGLARNWALLKAAGRRLVVFDDDTLCDVFERNETLGGISISNKARDAEFFPDNSSWPGFQPAPVRDPAAAHLECLGRDVAGAVRTLGIGELGQESLAGAGPGSIGRLHGGSPVLITQCGTLGDPGSNNNTWITRLPPAAMKRMLQSEQQVAHGLRNSSAWLGRWLPHIAPASNMSQITGLDNRRLLPPYFPIMRGEDELFGYMINYVYPDLAVLDYPWAVPHLPIPERDRSGDAGGFGGSANFPRFFVKWVSINKATCYGHAPEDRLRHLGEAFMDLGQSAPRDIEELYRDERMQDCTDRLARLKRQLAEAHDAPANWQAFLQAGVTELERNLEMQTEELPVKGFPAGVEGDELITLWKGHWHAFGEALVAWPEVMEAARALEA